MELIKRHLKRDYERELTISQQGIINHYSCIDHCLPYAFGICIETHTSRCENCAKFYNFFKNISTQIDSTKLELLHHLKQKLIFYMAHQTRKYYLNAQVHANLLQLDNEGAVLIVDYKMRILPKTARETKQEYFGKRGWTLHTILMYTKQQGQINLNVSAYDHWSSDIKQDAWFTASSFEAVFGSIERNQNGYA